MSSPYSNGNPGGFINPRHSKTRAQKMTWTAANDRKLLLIGLGKEIIPAEYPKIAASFPEKPTNKAIQERYAKLRKEQRIELGRMKLAEPTSEIPEVDENVDDAATGEGDEGSSNELPAWLSNMTAEGLEAAGAKIRDGMSSTLALASSAVRPSRSTTTSAMASPAPAAEDEEVKEEDEVGIEAAQRATPTPRTGGRNSTTTPSSSGGRGRGRGRR